MNKQKIKNHLIKYKCYKYTQLTFNISLKELKEIYILPYTTHRSLSDIIWMANNESNIKNLLKNHCLLEIANILNVSKYIIKSTIKFFNISYNKNKEKKLSKKYKEKHMLEIYGFKHNFCKGFPGLEEKRKSTYIKNWGVNHPSKSKKFQEKRKQKCLEDYGVENTFQREDVKEKYKNTIKKKYKVDNISKSPKIKKKKANTCKKHWGVNNPLKSKYIRDKGKITIMKKYKSLYPIKNPEVREKMRLKSIQKWGYDHPSKSPEVKEKAKKTIMNKYKGHHYMNDPNFIKNFKSKYTYKSINFDSSWELAFYIYCEDNNIKIKYHSKTFKYKGKDNKIHEYMPDFYYKRKYIEIKNDKAIDKKGNLINLYKNEFNYKEKSKCMKDNNIIIWTYKDIKQYLDYIKNKYGKTYLKQFKNCKNVYNT